MPESAADRRGIRENGGSGACFEPAGAPCFARAGTMERGALESLYLGLFTSALLAATVLPGASEILMLGLVVQGLDAWTLWLVATLGNVAGSTLNWWMGRYA